MIYCDFKCYVIFVFLTLSLFGLQYVIVVFPDHTHLLLLLHQANRLENLVQLSKAESHTIGIKPDHGIDDAIAKIVFDKCVEKWIRIFP